jgi:hypothetical protein
MIEYSIITAADYRRLLRDVIPLIEPDEPEVPDLCGKIAQFYYVDTRTARRWVSGQKLVPAKLVNLLRLMRRYKPTPAQVQYRPVLMLYLYYQFSCELGNCPDEQTVIRRIHEVLPDLDQPVELAAD